MNLSEFLPKYFESALLGIYGIMGHKNFYREELEMRRFYTTAVPAAVGGSMFLLLLLIGRERTPAEVRRALLIVFLFSLLYISVVALDNFNSFQLVRLFGYGLQGRYLFPVLSSFVAVCAFCSFYRIRGLQFSLPLAIIIAAVYLDQSLWCMVERLQQVGFF
jgi:hypothetical protein